MRWLQTTLRIFAVLILVTAPAILGCEGSKPREAVDDTVEELTGKKNVDRMKKMQKDIGNIEGQQDERMKQLEQTND
jgi:hypothetical protein